MIRKIKLFRHGVRTTATIVRIEYHYQLAMRMPRYIFSYDIGEGVREFSCSVQISGRNDLKLGDKYEIAALPERSSIPPLPVFRGKIWLAKNILCCYVFMLMFVVMLLSFLFG